MAKSLQMTLEPEFYQEMTPKFQTFVLRCKSCVRCELAKTRQNVVVWRGGSQASIMILGEAPGANEDERGVPFVGQSGKLLQRTLTEANLSEDAVHIANVVKCRPPNNRVPKMAEIEACRQLLNEQIALVKPQYIICLGQTAYTSFTGDKTPITQVKGKIQELNGRLVMATFHPAYILRSRSHQPSWLADFSKIRECIEASAVGGQSF